MKSLNYFKQELKNIKEIHENDSEQVLEDLELLKSEIILVMLEIDNEQNADFIGLKSLKSEIDQFIRDIEKEDEVEFDPEAELDAMFPNRHDDDFDDDSMSYDSVFGGD